MTIFVTVRAMPFVHSVALMSALINNVGHVPTYWAAWVGSAVMLIVTKPPASTALPGVWEVLFNFRSFESNSYC